MKKGNGRFFTGGGGRGAMIVNLPEAAVHIAPLVIGERVRH
jgi:hypothetical protein